MRRMSGRNPNFALVGLVFVSFLLIYKCWTLSSQNDDLRKEIDKLQTELKISEIKQEQYEQKNQKLQGSVHDLDEKEQKLKAQKDEQEQQIQQTLNSVKTKEYEITSLKNSLLRKEAEEKDLIQQIEEKESKIEQLGRDSQHILTLKNDAEEALAEKDSQINNLKRELEQLKKDVAFKQKEEIAHQNFNAPVPNMENKGNLVGMQDVEYPVLQNQRLENHNPVIQEPHHPQPKEQGQMVLMPPQNHQAEPYLAPGGSEYVPKRAVHVHNVGAQGLLPHPGYQILPRQPSNAIRSQPRLSVAKMVNAQKFSKNQIEQSNSKPVFGEQVIRGDAVKKGGEGEISGNVIPNPPLSAQELHHQDQDNHVNGVIEKPNNKPLIGNLVGMQDVANPVLQDPNLHDPNQRLENHNPVIQEPHHPQPKEQGQMVLMPPQNHQENLDAAVDEDAKVVEDPSDDQDEEGKEIKRDLENNAADNYDNYDDDKVDNPHLIKDNNNNNNNIDDMQHEPKGIGAMEIGKQDYKKNVLHDHRDDVNLVDDVDQRANEHVFEGNMDNKIRNLPRL